MAVATKFYAWSFSRLTLWEECPLRAKLQNLDRIETPKGPALERGNIIHKEAEDYALGRIKITPNLKSLEGDFKILKASNPLVEQQWAFNVNWEPTEWFGRDAYVRIICDAVTMPTPDFACVIDHKTGKLRDGYQEQVELFSTGVFSRYGSVQEAATELWYLDHGTIIQNAFHRKDHTSLKKKWSKRAAPMLKDEKFPPKPGNHCRWCHFRRSNGTGLCPY